MNERLVAHGLSLTGTWPTALQTNLEEALFTHIGEENIGFWLKKRPVTLRFGGSDRLRIGTYYGLTSGTKITFFANQSTNPVINILHEFGHLVDNLWDDFFTNSLKMEEFCRNERFFAGWNGRDYLGLRRDFIRSDVLMQRNIAGGDAWQQRGGKAHWEDWADIFSNAMLGNFNAGNEVGGQILAFVARMNAHVREAPVISV